MLHKRWTTVLASTGVCVGLLLPGVPAASAQATGTVQGTVRERVSGRPVEGVVVSVLGTRLQATTNVGGVYTIREVSPGSYTIRAVRIGYGPMETPVTVAAGQEVVADFGMSPAAIELDQIVVTGTPGGTEKTKLGNSVSAIDAPKLTEVNPIADVQDLLSSRTPGLSLLGNSGQAGASSNIRIRGAGSLEANYAPVYYVDGVRFESQTQDAFGTRDALVQGTSPLDFINPNDIERVEVIKGPAAATLYGAEAAGGVIQIITKKGRRGAGGTQWSVGMESGETDWASNIPMPNNYWLCQPLHIRSPSTFPGCAGMDSTAPAERRLLVDSPLREHRRALRTGGSRKVDLSARGGGDLFNYYLSFDRHTEDGVVFNNFDRRVGGRANFGFTPSSRLDLALNLSYTRTHSRMPLQDNASNGLVRNALRGRAGATADPWEPGWRGFGPGLINGYDNQTKSERLMLGLTAQYQPWSWFKNRLILGLDKQDRKNAEFFAIDTTGRAPWGAIQATGTISLYLPTTHTWTVDYAGTVSLALTPTLRSDFSGGLQLNSRERRSTWGFGEGLVANNLNLVGAAAVTRADESFSKQTSLGFYVQEQLGWRDRVYGTAALRIDDNSAFGSDFSLLVFPKLSLSYLISEEAFFRVPHVDQLKLRFAFGKAGRAPAPFSADRTDSATTTTENGVSVNQLTPASFGNPSLRGETGSEFEAGFDASLLRGRAGIEFTYYNKHTKHALIEVPNPPSSGYPGEHLENVGEISNVGVELQVNGTPIYTPRFSWDATLVVSANRNRLVSFGGVRTQDSFGQFATVQKHIEGYPLGGYWAVDVVRDPSGRPVLDGSGNVIVDLNDDYFVGPSAPTREAALSNTFTLFGNLRVYTHIDYKGDWYMWCALCSIRNRIDQNTWEINNPHADPVDVKVVQSLQTARWIMPADFIKLREVSLSYTLPAAWARSFRAQRVTVTLAGRNLMRWTRYKGTGDPEVNFSSEVQRGDVFTRTDYASVPPMRYLSASVRITF
jgi:TonB-dependent starch-binding outer membrane protein SusC